MIRVRLILLNEKLKEDTDEKEITLELSEEEATVNGLLRKASMKYGDKMLGALSKPGASILLNGQNIEFLGGINAKLSDGDRVAIIPIIAGGFEGERIYTPFNSING